MRNNGKALLARNAELEAENARLRELALIYARIAYYDGFRAATLWVPDVWNMEAQEQAFNWVMERRAQIEADLAEPPKSEIQ